MHVSLFSALKICNLVFTNQRWKSGTGLVKDKTIFYLSRLFCYRGAFEGTVRLFSVQFLWFASMIWSNKICSLPSKTRNSIVWFSRFSNIAFERCVRVRGVFRPPRPQNFTRIPFYIKFVVWKKNQNVRRIIFYQLFGSPKIKKWFQERFCYFVSKNDRWIGEKVGKSMTFCAWMFST